MRIACSQFVRNLLHEHYGVDSDVIWTPVEAEAYPQGRGPRDGRPMILAVGDFNVRRTGAAVLVKAFELVLRELPAARLRLSGRLSPVSLRRSRSRMSSVRSSA